jgi:probable F420-dependent oxidoreductase
MGQETYKIQKPISVFSTRSIMRYGIIFPEFEFGSDPAAIKDYAQTAEGLGLTHIGNDDHVVGPNPDRPGGWTGWVTYKVPFREEFTLFSFWAAVTRKIEFVTCVLLLPQRQTVMVAKQAAEVDVLSGGRLRLGVGLGWNEIEYISLNEDFHNRGKRVEEQVTLLRQLWTQPLVEFKGRWHTIPDAGINPLPVQRPIPIWFGGQSEPMIKRVAKMGDGWMPLYNSAEEAKPGLALLAEEMAKIGRSQENFGFEARLKYGDGSPDMWRRKFEDWQAVGATHLSLVTTGCGLQTPEEHIEAMRRYAELVLD